MKVPKTVICRDCCKRKRLCERNFTISNSPSSFFGFYVKSCIECRKQRRKEKIRRQYLREISKPDYADKKRERNRNWHKMNIQRVKEKHKKADLNARKNMTDRYIKRTLVQRLKIDFSDVTGQMIAVQRNSLQMKRFIKNG